MQALLPFDNSNAKLVRKLAADEQADGTAPEREAMATEWGSIRTLDPRPL
jgi:hypothetical protein